MIYSEGRSLYEEIRYEDGTTYERSEWGEKEKEWW